MKALETHSNASFCTHDTLQEYLADIFVNRSLYTFILSMEQRYNTSLNALDLFNEAYKLCQRSVNDPSTADEFSRQHILNDNHDKTVLLPYIMTWAILSSQKRLPYSANLCINQLHSLIKRSPLYSLAKEQVNLKATDHLINIQPSRKSSMGDIYQQYNIQQVQNLNPNATTVINNYYDRNGKPTGEQKANSQDSQSEPHEKAAEPQENIDTTPLREEILRYVSYLNPIIADTWKQGYDNLWNAILDIPEVAAQIYNPGKQQKTSFNRNLVANIIHYLGTHGMVKEYNAAQITERLEGDKDHSVRRALGSNPDDAIIASINNILQ